VVVEVLRRKIFPAGGLWNGTPLVDSSPSIIFSSFSATKKKPPCWLFLSREAFILGPFLLAGLSFFPGEIPSTYISPFFPEEAVHLFIDAILWTLLLLQ